MALVKAICTHCGGVLDVDNEKDAWVCKYCNTPFIVEKAVNIYNTNTTVKAEHVDYYGGKASMEELIQRADAYSTLNEQAKLRKTYEEMIEGYPARYEGYWGMITCETNDFTNYNQTDYRAKERFNKITKLMKLCKQFAPAEVYPSLNEKYTDYVNKYSVNQQATDKQTMKVQIDNLQKNITYLNQSIENNAKNHAVGLNNSIKSEKKAISSCRKHIVKLFFIAYILINTIVGTIELIGQGMFGTIDVLFVVDVILFVAMLILLFTYKDIKKHKAQIQEYQNQLNQPFHQPDLENQLAAAQQELAQLEQRLNSIQ